MSQEYISALVILLVSVLRMFKIEVANDAVDGAITVILAIWIAIRRYQKGDITIGGRKLIRK